MRNLYSLTKRQDAIRRITRAMDTTGNLPPLPGISPDYEAPIIRTGEDGALELVKARWGMADIRETAALIARLVRGV